MSNKTIGVDPDKAFGLLKDATAKVHVAVKKGDNDFIVTLGTFLKMSPAKRNELFGSAAPLAKDNEILRLLSGDESLIIDECDGTETIAKAKAVFPSGIDGDFKNWGTDKPGTATEATAVDVHELIKNATFANMFTSFGTDLDKLCLTQSQIIQFCKKFPSWLRHDGYATFFLFKVEDQFFVALVGVSSVGLYVLVHRFEDVDVWDAEDRRRLVVPQQTV
jgi:hypothetical protein